LGEIKLNRRVLSLERAFYRWVTGDWSTSKLYDWCMRHYGKKGWKRLIEMEREFKKEPKRGKT